MKRLAINNYTNGTAIVKKRVLSLASNNDNNSHLSSKNNKDNVISEIGVSNSLSVGFNGNTLGKGEYHTINCK